MDIISSAMTEESAKEELPPNFQKFIDINNIFQNKDIEFDLQYNISKRNNSLLIENLKFANSKWLEKSDFENIGLKSRKNMFGKMQYFKNGIRNGKDTEVLNKILENLNKVYDVNYDEPIAELTMQQKIAQKISANRFLRKIPFIEKFIKEQLYVLPDTTEKLENNSINNRKMFVAELLSKGGEYEGFGSSIRTELEGDENLRDNSENERC